MEYNLSISAAHVHNCVIVTSEFKTVHKAVVGGEKPPEKKPLCMCIKSQLSYSVPQF